jgi:Ring finger domain
VLHASPRTSRTPWHVQCGTSAARIAALRSGTHAQLTLQCDCTEGKCTVCQDQFEGDDVLLQLPCRHHFHLDCIVPWLKDSKMCPVCMTEVAEAPADAGSASAAGANPAAA